MATRYSLTCINNSNRSGSFAIFQRPPPIDGGGPIYAVTWFASLSAPQTRMTFEWTIDYSFVRAETGVLLPGVTFIASQAIPADPMGKNLIELATDNYGMTYFTPPETYGRAGTLTIQQWGNVAQDRTSCGIGMSGAAIYAVQAAQNITTVFKPHPDYWVAFGRFNVREVVDFQQITGKVEVPYQAPVTSRTVTLQPDNLLVVS